MGRLRSWQWRGLCLSLSLYSPAQDFAVGLLAHTLPALSLHSALPSLISISYPHEMVIRGDTHLLPSLQPAFLPGQLPPPPSLPTRAPPGWQDNNSEEDE